jgi:hypothetical protein
MWWKLTGLFLLAAALVFAVVPIRTHALLYDVTTDAPSGHPSFANTIGIMYLTPGTVLTILCIVAVTGYAAYKVARGHW